MNKTTIIMILSSIGFIMIGLLMLKSNKLKDILDSSNMYKDTEKYIKFNGNFNVLIGIVGVILGALDYLLNQDSNYIVSIFLVTITVAVIVQKIVGKKYKK